jgi:hypothetical protein
MLMELELVGMNQITPLLPIMIKLQMENGFVLLDILLRMIYLESVKLDIQQQM